MAKCGNSAAVQTFSEFGNLLGKALKPALKQFRADCLMCGGRISHSFSLFEKPLRSQLKELKVLKTITPAQSIDLATLRGSARQILFPNQK